MRLLPPLMLALMLLGCADTHKVTRTEGSKSAVSLQRQASAYGAVPSDGRYGPTVYSGSGATVAQVVAAAFGSHLERVTTGTKIEELDQALSSAKAGGFTYLLYPQILHWEDRATEWSAKPDLVTVKLSTYAAQTGQLLDSAMIDGKSGIATFGGDRPQDLLPKPMAEYAVTLFK